MFHIFLLLLFGWIVYEDLHWTNQRTSHIRQRTYRLLDNIRRQQIYNKKNKKSKL